MKKEAYLLAGTAVALVATAAVGVVAYKQSRPPDQPAAAPAAGAPAPAAAPLIRPYNHALGAADAKVTVVEFLDPECESCRAMYPMVKHLLAQYPGRVRLVVRYMPFHPNSLLAAGALEAAGEQGKYWEMLETLFEHQPQWGDHHHPRPEMIPELAAKLGLDMARFNTAMGASAHREKVQQDEADGKNLGVVGTPSFFVNGKKLERLGYEPLQALIEEALAR
jgi:protein-disulfide isomerase